MSLTITKRITQEQLDKINSGSHCLYILPASSKNKNYSVTVVISRNGQASTPTGVFETKDDVKVFFDKILELFDNGNQRDILEFMSNNK